MSDNLDKLVFDTTVLLTNQLAHTGYLQTLWQNESLRRNAPGVARHIWLGSEEAKDLALRMVNEVNILDHYHYIEQEIQGIYLALREIVFGDCNLVFQTVTGLDIRTVPDSQTAVQWTFEEFWSTKTLIALQAAKEYQGRVESGDILPEDYERVAEEYRKRMKEEMRVHSEKFPNIVKALFAKYQKLKKSDKYITLIEVLQEKYQGSRPAAPVERPKTRQRTRSEIDTRQETKIQYVSLDPVYKPSPIHIPKPKPQTKPKAKPKPKAKAKAEPKSSPKPSPKQQSIRFKSPPKKIEEPVIYRNDLSKKEGKEKTEPGIYRLPPPPVTPAPPALPPAYVFPPPRPRSKPKPKTPTSPIPSILVSPPVPNPSPMPPKKRPRVPPLNLGNPPPAMYGASIGTHTAPPLAWDLPNFNSSNYRQPETFDPFRVIYHKGMSEEEFYGIQRNVIAAYHYKINTGASDEEASRIVFENAQREHGDFPVSGLSPVASPKPRPRSKPKTIPKPKAKNPNAPTKPRTVPQPNLVRIAENTPSMTTSRKPRAKPTYFTAWNVDIEAEARAWAETDNAARTFAQFRANNSRGIFNAMEGERNRKGLAAVIVRRAWEIKKAERQAVRPAPKRLGRIHYPASAGYSKGVHAVPWTSIPEATRARMAPPAPLFPVYTGRGKKRSLKGYGFTPKSRCVSQTPNPVMMRKRGGAFTFGGVTTDGKYTCDAQYRKSRSKKTA